jgi:hypothetical protein
MYSHQRSSELNSRLHFVVQSSRLPPTDSTNYTIIAQDLEQVRDAENSPEVSMEPFLQACSRMDLVGGMSVYSRVGYDRKHMRLLYMNRQALSVWITMGMRPRVVGTQHRPPHTAVLIFGIAFD